MDTKISAGLATLFVFCLTLLSGIDGTAKEEHQSMAQQAHSFEAEITITVRLNYLLFLPQGYGEEPEQRHPLILFLHGAGERGDDLEVVKKHGIPKIVEKQAGFPFIAVSPQCPQDSWWTTETAALNALLDEIVETYAVDTNRIYLTGLSMGGYGTWTLATASPNRFAAIAPICGGGNPDKACLIKDVPTWVFHGAKDAVVKPEESEKMVDALKTCGSNVRFTLYPDANHDSWTETYDNPDLYSWFLEHTR